MHTTLPAKPAARPATRPPALRSVALLAATPALLLAILPGCARQGRALIDDPARAYPVELAITEAADIHVFRNDTRLSLTNTTPDQIGPGTLWLNKEFSAPFEPMPPGQTRTLTLYAFTNRYGQAFRAGGFFAIRSPARLVSVELLEDDRDEFIPLLVVRGTGN